MNALQIFMVFKQTYGFMDLCMFPQIPRVVMNQHFSGYYSKGLFGRHPDQMVKLMYVGVCFGVDPSFPAVYCPGARSVPRLHIIFQIGDFVAFLLS